MKQTGNNLLVEVKLIYSKGKFSLSAAFLVPLQRISDDLSPSLLLLIGCSYTYKSVAGLQCVEFASTRLNTYPAKFLKVAKNGFLRRKATVASLYYREKVQDNSRYFLFSFLLS